MTSYVDLPRCDDHQSDPCGGSALPEGAIAIAWPTGRPIYPYTVDELAEGVDLYTRAVKAAARLNHSGGRHEA